MTNSIKSAIVTIILSFIYVIVFGWYFNCGGYAYGFYLGALNQFSFWVSYKYFENE